MKNQSLLPLLILALAATLTTGCLQTRTAVKEQEEKQVLKKQVQNLAQNTADVNSRFQDIDDEFRRVNGRVEVLETKINQLGNNQQEKAGANETKLKELDEKLRAYQEAISKLDAQVAELSQQLSQVQQSQKSNDRGGKEKGSYDTAEELFEKGEWKEAILNYEKYRKGNPKGKTYGMATYKIGVCFQELGLKEDAEAFYQEVISKFPKTQEAIKASTRLKGLKK